MLLQPAWLPDRHSTNLDWFIKIADLMDQFGIEEGLARLEQDAQFIDYRKSWPDAANSLAGQFQKPQAAQRSARLRQLPSDRPLGSWQPVAQLLTSTLVLGTERDPLHPLEYAEQWVSYFPIAQLKTAPPKSIDPGEYTQAIRNEVRRFLAAP
jgi:hypothetical protein